MSSDAGSEAIMKKNIVLIIIAAVVVAGLAGVMIFVTNLPQSEESGISSDTLDILLYDKTSVKPEQITVNNSGGEYNLIGFDYTGMADEIAQQNGEVSTEASVSSEDSEGSESSAAKENSNARKNDVSSVKINMRYTMQDYEDLELDKTATDALAYQCSYVAALQLVDKTGRKYAEFGLDKPASTVNVQFSDGTKETLYLGNKAPNDMGYYFRREASPNVYLMNSEMVSSFLTEKLQMLEKTITKDFNDDEDVNAEIKSVSISGAGYDKPVSIDKEDDISISSTYKLRSPYHLACGKEAADTFGKNMYGIKGTEVAAANVNDEDKKKYGLDKPYMDIIVKASDDSTVRLYVSKAEKDGSCYVMADDGKIIFKMSRSDAEKWYGAKYTDFLTTAFVYPNIDRMDKLVITKDGKSVKYDIKHERKKNDLLEDFSITTVFNESKPVDYNNFSTYITNYTGLVRAGLEVKDPASYSEVFKAEFAYSGDDKKTVNETLSIRKGKDGSYIVYLNDMLMGYTEREYAEKLIAQSDSIMKKGKIESLITAEEDKNVETSKTEQQSTASETSTASEQNSKN